MNIQLSDHFTYTKLIQFALPSIGMMIFTSIYGVVDGLFISNFVGKTAFAAVNLIIPFTMVLGAIGFMLGTGGNALVAKTLGEGKRELANQIFSSLSHCDRSCRHRTPRMNLSSFGFIWVATEEPGGLQSMGSLRVGHD